MGLGNDAATRSRVGTSSAAELVGAKAGGGQEQCSTVATFGPPDEPSAEIVAAMRVSQTECARAEMSTACGRSTRRKTAASSGAAGQSVNSTRWQVHTHVDGACVALEGSRL